MAILVDRVGKRNRLLKRIPRSELIDAHQEILVELSGRMDADQQVCVEVCRSTPGDWRHVGDMPAVEIPDDLLSLYASMTGISMREPTSEGTVGPWQIVYHLQGDTCEIEWRGAVGSSSEQLPPLAGFLMATQAQNIAELALPNRSILGRALMMLRRRVYFAGALADQLRLSRSVPADERRSPNHEADTVFDGGLAEGLELKVGMPGVSARITELPGSGDTTGPQLAPGSSWTLRHTTFMLLLVATALGVLYTIL